MSAAAGKPPLPAGWRWVRLGEVCTITMGQSPDGTSYNFDGVGVPLLNGPTEFGPLNPVPVQWTTAPMRFAEPGDILFCVRGATTGRMNLADRRYCIGRGIAAVKGVEGSVDTGFLRFLLATVTDSLLRETAGSTFPNLSGEKFERFSVGLPPFLEQRRIAAILNEQMAAVERARAAAEAQLEAAKALTAAYLRAVFTSPEAQRWPRRALGDIVQLMPSKSIASDGDAEVFAITTACLDESGFKPSGVKTARMRAADASECEVAPGEILIARSNTPELVGRAAMFSGEPKGAVATDLTIRLRVADSVEAPFLTAYLACLYLTGYWKDRAGGASGSMKKITRTQVQNERVPVPLLREQREIVARLSQQMAAAERTRQAVEAQLAAINALPAAFLRQAFSGRIGPEVSHE